MAQDSQHVRKSINLKPNASPDLTQTGDLGADSSDSNRLKYNRGTGAQRILLTEDAAAPSFTTAANVTYDNTTSGLTATTTQAAVDELKVKAATAQSTADNHISDTVDAHDASAISSIAAGNLAATDVQAALNELQSDIDTRATATALTNHINNTTDAHDASAISSIPSGSLAATDVQAAINELDTEKAPLASPTFTGVPAAPTAALHTNTTQLATTAFTKAEVDDHINDTTSAHAASSIAVTPVGGVAATDVQAAIQELDSEKATTGYVDGKVSDIAYDATSWNGVTDAAPSKNAVRDKIEQLQPLDSDLTTIASLTATTDSFLQAKSSAWTTRTPTQVTADLIAVVGDSGSGGTKGLVPAPAAGDAAAGKYLKADGTWATVSTGGSVSPTLQKFLSTGTKTGSYFVVTAANATVGATYTNNGQTFTVLQTISGATALFTSGSGSPTASGTLTKATGTGDATITFSSTIALATYTRPTSPTPVTIKVKIVGAGGGGGGTGSSGSSDGGAGGSSIFDYLVAGGGGGGTKSGSSLAGSAGTISIGSYTGFVIGGATGSAGGVGNVAYSPSGAGGSSFFGGAGGGSADTAYSAATNSGSGGGGGGSSASTSITRGGGGGSGAYGEISISSPAASYYYAVGAAGAAGGAGTSGYAGGAGGAGLIIVEEIY